jgi:hypothetical protein
MVITFHLCVLGIKSDFCLIYNNKLVFIDLQSVYSAVRTEPLYNTDTFRL